MGTYVKANVNKPTGMPGRGITPKDKITVIDVEDIDTFPARDEAGVVIAEDIVMKNSKYGVGIYVTPGTAALSSNSEGDTDAQGFRPSLQFSHPGNKQDVREFKTNWLGKNCIVIIEYCNGEMADIIGSPCNPCQMAVEYTGNNESNANSFTFQQVAKGDDIGIYLGSVTTSEGVANNG